MGKQKPHSFFEREYVKHNPGIQEGGGEMRDYVSPNPKRSDAGISKRSVSGSREYAFIQRQKFGGKR